MGISDGSIVGASEVSEMAGSLSVLLLRGTSSNYTEATWSWLFATWITSLSKEVKLLFPFPTKEQVLEWMPLILNDISEHTHYHRLL